MPSAELFPHSLSTQSYCGVSGKSTQLLSSLCTVHFIFLEGVYDVFPSHLICPFVYLPLHRAFFFTINQLHIYDIKTMRMTVFFYLRVSVCNCKVYEVQAEWLWWRFIILTPRFWKATKPKEKGERSSISLLGEKGLCHGPKTRQLI